MNNVLSINIVRFILLVILQVFLFNNINFLGYLNPFIYILFIFLYPVNNNRMYFLFFSFLIGLSIDVFMDSGGVNACASLVLAYIRPILLKVSFGTLYDHQSIKFNKMPLSSLIIYISVGILIHHVILFSLEVFNISFIVLTLKKTLFSSVFSIITNTMFVILFLSKNK